MEPGAEETPSLEQIRQLLNSRAAKCVASTGDVTVTVGPQLELLAVELGGPGIVPEHRTALEQAIVTAVNRAMREVVITSARTLEALREPAEMQAIRNALQKEVDRRSC